MQMKEKGTFTNKVVPDTRSAAALFATINELLIMVVDKNMARIKSYMILFRASSLFAYEW